MAGSDIRRDGPGILGDLRLLGVDDVHDHAALEHLGEAALDAHRAGLGHVTECSHPRIARSNVR
jgi:hypothetical protein